MTSRTNAVIGGKIMSGLSCDRCGVTYADCTREMLTGKGRPCCGTCHYTGTHDEKEEATVAPRKIDSMEIQLSAIEGLSGMAEDIENAANGPGTLRSCVVDVNDNVTLAYDGAKKRWTLVLSA